MHTFLIDHREELTTRCKAKAARRDGRAFTQHQLGNGIPILLDQLIRTFNAEYQGQSDESFRISGASGGDQGHSEIGASASSHGSDLLRLGFSVDQVVHNYGDLCQAITDLAFEQNTPITVNEFRTLNRCLDNAIADAVTAYSLQRDLVICNQESSSLNQRVGFLVHELRNGLSTATLAVSALESGNLTVSGATGAVLKRSLASIKSLLDTTLEEVRGRAPKQVAHQSICLADFILEAKHAGELDAAAKGCVLHVGDVDPLLRIDVHRDSMMAALGNLLHNAFKFTHHGSEVSLNARQQSDRILIEVGDHCGGLPHGSALEMFKPFVQRSADRSGLGLGLSIARHTVEAADGTLSVRDVPGVGCVFTIDLPAAV